MISTGVVTRDDFERALGAAAKVGSEVPLTGLAAPLDATWLGRIAEAWDNVETALGQAFQWGREAARESLDQAVAKAEELVRTAGRRARDVHEALLERIQTYLDLLVRGALAQVRGVIDVGGMQLRLVSVDVAQRISLTGSLKAALTELVAITAAGEITVSANYGS